MNGERLWTMLIGKSFHSFKRARPKPKPLFSARQRQRCLHEPDAQRLQKHSRRLSERPTLIPLVPAFKGLAFFGRRICKEAHPKLRRLIPLLHVSTTTAFHLQPLQNDHISHLHLRVSLPVCMHNR